MQNLTIFQNVADEAVTYLHTPPDLRWRANDEVQRES
jgi:hypothetical protein